MKTVPLSKLKQVSFFVLPFIALSVAFPFVVWQIVLSVASGEGSSSLVGEPDGVDPGAVITTLVYAAFAGVTAWGLHKRNHQFASKSVIGLGVVLGGYTFMMVSSLIWF